jgi:two-component system sensor histidine kinase VicK
VYSYDARHERLMMRLPRQLLGMRWWLALAFAGVAGLTAVAIVGVFGERTERAFRTNAQEFAVGNAVAASEALKRVRSESQLRDETARISARRGISLFVFDGSGVQLSSSESDAVAWSSVPGGEQARDIALGGGRYIQSEQNGAAFVIGVRIYEGPGRGLVAYSIRPEFEKQLSIIRSEYLQAAALAFVVGAALGLLIARLTARRLARIARAAKAIGGGDFSTPVSDRFPDEVGSLAESIEAMRTQLQGLFQQLEGDRDRLESLVDRLNEGVLLIDSELNIEFANERARDLLGAGERLDGDGVLGPARARKLRELALDLFRVQLPSRVRLEDDESTLVVSGIPPAGDRDTAIIVVQDESQRERNERAQREFATNAAHELRTPLASIVTAVEMLQTGAKEDPESRDQFLEMIARESDRLTRLTRALLVLARAEAREEVPRLTTVRVAPLLEQVAGALPRRDGVRIGVDCPPSLAIAGDADLLEQALSSLGANAVRHTAAGSVTMSGRWQNGSVVIEVADTGSGIPARDRSRIFDRFYRAGDRDDGSGFGLGLSIARESVRTLGGEVELHSEEAVGTTVRITLAPATIGEDG